MLRALHLVRRSIVTFGLVALMIVLFPGHAQPLWDWMKSTSAAVGQDPLPSFNTAQNMAGGTLLTLVLSGIGYTFWRDRRLEVLQAEYTHQTGAKHLKEKVRELMNQVDKVTAERDTLQEKLSDLTREYMVALVAAKEHEVRSQYGREDRDELRALRKGFEELLKEKGHTEGFRVAMDLMLRHFSQDSDGTGFSLHAGGAKRDTSTSPGQRDALPYSLQ